MASHKYSKRSPAAIVEEMDSTGLACLNDVVGRDWLSRAQAAVEDYVESHGNKYFSVINPGGEQNSPFFDLIHNPALTQLFLDVSRLVVPSMTDERFQDYYNVLRINAGSSGSDGAFNFHYDASILTAVLPIFIPSGELGNCGELVIFANKRPYRSLVAHNIIEKALVQNTLYRKLAMRRLSAHPEGHVHSLMPGNIYLFWGYRTYHGNLACNPPALRATLVIHYGNPHGNSSTLRAIRRGRRIVESIRLKIT